MWLAVLVLIRSRRKIAWAERDGHSSKGVSCDARRVGGDRPSWYPDYPSVIKLDTLANYARVVHDSRAWLLNRLLGWPRQRYL